MKFYLVIYACIKRVLVGTPFGPLFSLDPKLKHVKLRRYQETCRGCHTLLKSDSQHAHEAVFTISLSTNNRPSLSNCQSVSATYSVVHPLYHLSGHLFMTRQPNL